MIDRDRRILKKLEDNLDKIIIESRTANPEYKVDVDRYLQGYENCKQDLEEVMKTTSVIEKIKKFPKQAFPRLLLDKKKK